jgi:hypothetical protein
MSGVLLGPPNHHEYTSKVIALHGSKFRNMPFEVFKSRIKMVRDEALIEQWKTEQSTKTVYTAVVPGEEDQVAPAPVAENESVAVETPVSLETTEATTEAALPTEETAPASEETSPEATAPAVEAATTETESAPSEGEAAEPSEEPTAESSSETKGLSFEEITADFLANHAENEIEPAAGELTLSGRAALHGSTKLLRELLLRHLRELDRFPLALAQAVGKELTSQGLQLFKSHKKIIHVSMARPRYLDRQNTPISENFKAILEYLEAHPNQRRDKQWNALLSIRTGIPLRPAKTEPVEVAQSEEAEATTPTTSSAAPAISEDEVKKHEQALGTDILWLLHQGHVIDFAMGNLQAATPPKPQPQKKEKAAPASKEASMDETLTGDAGAVQTGGSAASPADQSKDVIHEPAIHHEPLEITPGSVLETLPPEDPGQVLPN